MDLLAIATLLSLAAFGVKALFIASARNGLLGQFDKAREQRLSPAGVPLQQINTNGRFPALDWQIRAPAIFALIFCENISYPDTDLVGFSFVCAWGASWCLIVLESLRVYSQSRWLSWLAIPGILIYNHSHAVCTPLYLAFRLALAGTAAANDLAVDPAGLRVFPWTFVLGYVLPLTIMTWPLASARFEHTTVGWYQQWNLYISAVHYLLLWYWSEAKQPQSIAVEGGLPSLNQAYTLTMAMAAAGHWIPILIVCIAKLRPKLLGAPISASLTFRNILIPPSPFKARPSKTMFDGGKWLLQWDNFVGTTATAVWAMSLYFTASHNSERSLELYPLLLKMLGYLVLAGPMGVSIGLLWERDCMVVLR